LAAQHQPHITPVTPSNRLSPWERLLCSIPRVQRDESPAIGVRALSHRHPESPRLLRGEGSAFSVWRGARLMRARTPVVEANLWCKPGNDDRPSSRPEPLLPLFRFQLQVGHLLQEKRAVEAQLACVHDAICFLVACSRTDFVSCGLRSSFFSEASSARKAASEFLSFTTFHRSLIAFHFVPALLGPRASAVLLPKAGAVCLVYVFLTDIGRFSRNATTSALFIFKPPL